MRVPAPRGTEPRASRDLDDDRRPRLGEPGERRDRAGAIRSWRARACTAVIARRIASLVAGAASGGSTRWPPAAETASRIAKKTENGSSSGGSPVALLRWIVSRRRCRAVVQATLNTGGQSLAVGIL